MQLFGLFVTLMVITPPAVSLSPLQEKSVATAVDVPHCPPWTVASPPSNSCVCRGNLDYLRITCDNLTLDARVKIRHCLTYSKDFNITVIGSCLYTPGVLPDNRFVYPVPYRKSSNESMYTYEFCSETHLNRTGQLCGSCKDGYAHPVYSYNLACVKCKDYEYNWLKYIAVAFLPLTLFYIVIVVFSISPGSGVMSGYILACQLTTAPIMARRVFRHSTTDPKLSLIILVGLHAIWNLDFFRGLYSPFCLHPNLSTLQTLSLEYLIAVYPLFLILVTYVCVKLHSQYSFRIVLLLIRCFNRVHREWNIERNLPGAFATFLLLSYVKILNTSLDLLAPVAVSDIYGRKQPALYLFFDGTIEYFGKDHLPYALIALVMVLIFNILPLLLVLLYPCFQTDRGPCYNIDEGQHRFHSLQTSLTHFMDAFRGHYKPRYELFASVYIFVRILFVVIYCLTKGAEYFLPLIGLLVAWITCLFAVIRPFNEKFANAVNILFLMMITLTLFFGPVQMQIFATQVSLHTQHIFNVTYEGSLLAALLIFEVLYFTYKVVPKRILRRTTGCIKCYYHQKINGDVEMDMGKGERTLLLKKESKDFNKPSYTEINVNELLNTQP